MHFCEIKTLYFDKKEFDEACFSPVDKASIGSDNGSAPNMRQAIIWGSADLTHWRIYVALGGEESI